jgi:hypothetical protein
LLGCLLKVAASIFSVVGMVTSDWIMEIYRTPSLVSVELKLKIYRQPALFSRVSTVTC